MQDCCARGRDFVTDRVLRDGPLYKSSANRAVCLDHGEPHLLRSRTTLFSASRRAGWATGESRLAPLICQVTR